MATRKIYEFGKFQLDPAQRRIVKKGEIVALHAKAFDALVFLVEHAGEPVSRWALTEAMWPKRVVEDNNLTQAISALRRVLGDDCIVTLAGRGYQFVAEVRTIEVDPHAAATAIATEPPPVTRASSNPATVSAGRSLVSRRVVLVGAGVAVAAVLGIAAYLSPSPAERAVRLPLHGEPVTVLVLPFEAGSQNAPGFQSFADGLTDELIFRLQAVSSLRVLGPTTSFALRGSSAPEIAARVGVRYVVDGSFGVALDVDGLRVHAEIRDATGSSVWGSSFERPIAGIIELQDELVAAIAAQFGAPMGPNLASQRTTADGDAYFSYLAARSDVRNSDSAAYLRVLELVDGALQKDMKFAAAWSLKAQIHAVAATNSAFPDEREMQLDFAAQSAEMALALAPNDGEGYVARAGIRGIRGDWLRAERDYERARDLGYTDIADVPRFQLSTGRVALARETLERMFQTDPLNEATHAMLMLCYELSGQPDKADATYEHGRALQDSWVLGRAARTWIRLGREGEEAPFENENPAWARFVDPEIGPEEARARLRRAAMEPEYSSAAAKGTLAIYAAHYDDPQLALQLLEEAMAAQALSTYQVWLPVFHDIRQMPGFKELLVKIGLPQYWRESGWPEVCRPVGQSDFSCN